MMFDSHCHPQFPEYDADRAVIIQRAIEEGVSMLAVGTSVETSRQAIELTRAYPGKIWAAVGIHPTEESSQFDALSQLAAHPDVVAIGECGLDFSRLPTNPHEARATTLRQRERFLDHIALARALGKPLIIHSRRAYAETLAILEEHARGVRGVVHFFQGTVEEAARFIDLGFFISFAGPITFADSYREVVATVPSHRILVETDAPYATPSPHRGERNEPAYVRFIIEKIAEIKGESFETIAACTSENASRLFHISPR
jgi:TatD DNase family protein